MAQAVPDDARAARNKGIAQALSTSALARSSGLALQVISLPLAAIALGQDSFTAYAMLGAILAWLTLANFGISQATTLHISRSSGAGSRENASIILMQSWTIVFTISLLLSIFCLLVVLMTPALEAIFHRLSQTDDVPISGAVFVLVVFFWNQNLSVFEAAQLAQQRQHRLNSYMFVGTLIAAASVWWIARNEPNVLSILAAVHLPTLICRSLNALSVWFDLRPQLSHLVKLTRFDFRDIMGDGIQFLTGNSIGNLMCHPLSIISVGIFASPHIAASFAAVMNVVILVWAMCGYILSPLRGALPEAYARHDHIWVVKSYRTVALANVSLALVPGLLLIFFGSQIFGIWYGGSVSPSASILVAAGIYLPLLALEMTNYSFLASTNCLRAASRWMLMKGLLSALLVLTALTLSMESLVFWCLVLGNILLSQIPLNSLIARLLAELSYRDHNI